MLATLRVNLGEGHRAASRRSASSCIKLHQVASSCIARCEKCSKNSVRCLAEYHQHRTALSCDDPRFGGGISALRSRFLSLGSAANRSTSSPSSLAAPGAWCRSPVVHPSPGAQVAAWTLFVFFLLFGGRDHQGPSYTKSHPSHIFTPLCPTTPAEKKHVTMICSNMNCLVTVVQHVITVTTP